MLRFDNLLHGPTELIESYYTHGMDHSEKGYTRKLSKERDT